MANQSEKSTSDEEGDDDDDGVLGPEDSEIMMVGDEADRTRLGFAPM